MGSSSPYPGCPSECSALSREGSSSLQVVFHHLSVLFWSLAESEVFMDLRGEEVPADCFMGGHGQALGKALQVPLLFVGLEAQSPDFRPSLA